MKSWVCKWRHFWKTAIHELRHLLCWKLCKGFFLRSVHLYATLWGPGRWWFCCPRRSAGQMVTAHPRNVPGACADTRGRGLEPFPTQFLWNRCPVCLHLALPFACVQIQSCSPAGSSSSSSLGAAAPTDWPTGRKFVVGGLHLCRDCQPGAYPCACLEHIPRVLHVALSRHRTVAVPSTPRLALAQRGAGYK